MTLQDACRNDIAAGGIAEHADALGLIAPRKDGRVDCNDLFGDELPAPARCHRMVDRGGAPVRGHRHERIEVGQVFGTFSVLCIASTAGDNRS